MLRPFHCQITQLACHQRKYQKPKLSWSRDNFSKLKWYGLKVCDIPGLTTPTNCKRENHLNAVLDCDLIAIWAQFATMTTTIVSLSFKSEQFLKCHKKTKQVNLNNLTPWENSQWGVSFKFWRFYLAWKRNLTVKFQSSTKRSAVLAK